MCHYCVRNDVLISTDACTILSATKQRSCEKCFISRGMRRFLSPKRKKLSPRGQLLLAERVGFEPTVPLPVHWFSRPAHSATLSPLRPFSFPKGRVYRTLQPAATLTHRNRSSGSENQAKWNAVPSQNGQLKQPFHIVALLSLCRPANGMNPTNECLSKSACLPGSYALSASRSIRNTPV